MALLEIDWNPPPKKLRLFGGIWLPLFLIGIGVVLIATGSRPAIAWLLFGGAAVICVPAWIQPRLVRPIYVGWMAATFPIGWTISHLMLALIFFGVVTPIGLLLRLFGHDPLHLRPRGETSLWQRRPAADKIERYFKQF